MALPAKNRAPQAEVLRGSAFQAVLQHQSKPEPAVCQVKLADGPIFLQ